MSQIYTCTIFHLLPLLVSSNYESVHTPLCRGSGKHPHLVIFPALGKKSGVKIPGLAVTAESINHPIHPIPVRISDVRSSERSDCWNGSLSYGLEGRHDFTFEKMVAIDC